MHYNQSTGSEYQGRNQVELEQARQKMGYTSTAWLTWVQAKQAGLSIKKGSRGHSVFCGFQEFLADDGERYNTPKFAVVFNMDCLEQRERISA